MKVAVTADSPGMDAHVDQRMGRAAWFVVLDTETREHEAIPNSCNVDAAQGAGIQAAQALVRAGAQAVLTGHCGPKAFSVLHSAGIAVYAGCSGLVSEAVEAFQTGVLQQAVSADVESHW